MSTKAKTFDDLRNLVDLTFPKYKGYDFGHYLNGTLRRMDESFKEKKKEYEELFGKFEEIDSSNDYDAGDGGLIWRVYKFDDFDCLVKFTGNRSSYGDDNWNHDFRDVFSVKVERIVYRDKTEFNDEEGRG